MASSPKKKSWLRQYWWWVFGSFLLLAGLSLSPFLELGIRLTAPKLLKEHGVSSVSIGWIDVQFAKGQIRLEDVRLSSPDKGHLGFDRLFLDMSWKALIDRRFVLEQARVEVLDLKTVAGNGGYWLAGIKLPPDQSDATSTRETQNDPWGWGLESLSLKNSRVELLDPAYPLQIQITAFSVGAIDSQRPEKQTPLALQLQWKESSLGWKGVVAPLASSLNGKGALVIDGLSLAAIKPYLPPSLMERLEGRLDADMNTAFSLPQEEPVVTVGGTVRLKDTRVAHIPTGWDAFLKGLQTRLEVKLSGKTMVLETDLALEDAGLGRSGTSLVLLDQAEVKRLVWNSGLSLETLTVDQLKTLGVKNQPFFVADSVQLNDLALRDDRLAFGSFVGEGWVATLARGADGQLNLRPFLAALGEEGSSTAETEPSEDRQALNIALGDISVQNSRLIWTDQTLASPVEFQVEKLGVQLAAWDLSDAESVVPFALGAKQGEYGEMRTEGTIRGPLEDLKVELKGDLKQLELLPFSPYVALGIDQGVKHGQAGLTWEGTLNQESLGILTKLHLARFELAPLSGEQTGLSALSGMPLQQALGMLRDSNGDIRLEIPIEGRFDDPEFGLQNVIGTAVQKATQKAAFSLLAPLGIKLLTNVALPPGSLTIAGKLVELAATVRFDPVVYANGESALTETHRSQLNTLAAILKERPGIRVVLIGYAHRTEWLPSLSQVGEGQNPTPSQPASEEAIRQTLERLAAERAKGIKRYLVDQGIAPDRIFPAAPQVEIEGEATPRVEMGA